MRNDAEPAKGSASAFCGHACRAGPVGRTWGVSGETPVRVLAGLLYAAGTTYACFALWHYPRWTVDDAYIVFRYAKHLAFHGRLTWNLDSPPVEGYTGIALPLLVAAGMRSGIGPETLARAIGIASYFVAVWTLADNQRRLGVPLLPRAYVTAVMMLYPPLFTHATSGLETMAFVAVQGICLGRLLSCHAFPRRTAQAQLWSALLVLSLLRPEGVLVAAAFGAALAATAEHRSHRLAGSLLAAGLFVVPYAAYFAWRSSYYGRFFPNTYYAKAAEKGFDPGFLQGTRSLGDSFLPLVVAGAAIVVCVPRWRRFPVPPVIAALSCVVVLAIAYSRSTLLMSYVYRFQIHGLFLVAPLLGVLLASARWHELLRRCGRVKGGALGLLFAACLIGVPVEWIRAERNIAPSAQTYYDVMWEEHARVGTWLRDHLAASEPVACWIDAGIIPFLADDHVAIDFGRLNDRYLAQPGITRAHIADYFFSLHPGALVMTTDIAANVGPQYDGSILTADPRFDAYERERTFCSATHPRAPCEILYLRRGARAQ